MNNSLIWERWQLLGVILSQENSVLLFHLSKLKEHYKSNRKSWNCSSQSLVDLRQAEINFTRSHNSWGWMKPLKTIQFNLLLRGGFTGPYPVKSPRMETPQRLWTTHSSVQAPWMIHDISLLLFSVSVYCGLCTSLLPSCRSLLCCHLTFVVPAAGCCDLPLSSISNCVFGGLQTYKHLL